MYGDTRTIRHLADDLRHQAAGLRRDGDELLARAEAVAWQGLAAEAMRARARDRVAVLRRAADDHDRAAADLDRHAAEVDRVTASIAAIERRAQQLLDAARDRVGDLAEVAEGLRRRLPDPDDELLARFVPPPSGHRDWLAVDLPGVRR